VITLQSAMLVALGFLIALLLAFLVVPAYRRRLERIATSRVRRALPATEAEIRADKDRVRAESAVRVYALERQVEQARLSSARQLINLSRRDARINEAENEIRDLRAGLEEAQNARLVLEQTVTERLPRVEHRLAEAKKLLYQRDREIATLTGEAGKSARALEEAFQINVQSRAEIDRLTTSLQARAPNVNAGPSDASTEGTIALRAEIEALRARSRDQAELLAKLQSAERGRSDGAAQATDSSESAAIARLTRELEAAEQSLRALREAGTAGPPDAGTLEQQTRSLKIKIEDQASEIARLKASLGAYEDGAGASGATSIRDSKLALKARVSALQAQVDSQTEIIQKLRAETAAAHQKQARQAAQFVGEMRRLGAGPRSGNGAAAQVSAEARPKRSLAERLTEAPTAEAALAAPAAAAPDSAAKGLKALSAAIAGEHKNGTHAAADTASGTANPPADGAAEEPAASASKGRLLERLSSIAEA